MLRNGIPEEVTGGAAAASRAASAPGAARRRSRGRSHDGEDARLPRPRPCRSCTGRATAPPTRSSGTSERRILIAADHLIAHISSNPLIRRPLDGVLAEAAAGARHLHRVAAEDPRDAGRDRPLRPRRADHRPRRADRRAPRQARAAQGEDLRADRRAARAAATSSRRRSAATSPSPRPT